MIGVPRLTATYGGKTFFVCLYIVKDCTLHWETTYYWILTFHLTGIKENKSCSYCTHASAAFISKNGLVFFSVDYRTYSHAAQMYRGEAFLLSLHFLSYIEITMLLFYTGSTVSEHSYRRTESLLLAGSSDENGQTQERNQYRKNSESIVKQTNKLGLIQYNRTYPKFISMSRVGNKVGHFRAKVFSYSTSHMMY